MNSEIPEEVCDVSYELVIKRSSEVQAMYLKVTLEIRQLLPPFLIEDLKQSYLLTTSKSPVVFYIVSKKFIVFKFLVSLEIVLIALKESASSIEIVLSGSI